MIISYSIALMLISYGLDNIIVFFSIKKIGDFIRGCWSDTPQYTERR
jgi:hypothetical protein